MVGVGLFGELETDWVGVFRCEPCEKLIPSFDEWLHHREEFHPESIHPTRRGARQPSREPSMPGASTGGGSDNQPDVVEEFRQIITSLLPAEEELGRESWDHNHSAIP